MPGPTLADVQAALGHFDWDAWQAKLGLLYSDWYESTVTAAGKAAVKQHGGEWQTTDPFRTRFADRYVAERVTQISRTTRAQIQQVVVDELRRAQDAGESIGVTELGAQIADTFAEFARSRAQTIARTEVAIATNHGTLFGLVHGGYHYVQVSDGDGDEECDAADGQIWTIEEALADPIAHPNAIMGGTVVLPIGDVRVAFRAAWRGPAIRIRTRRGADATVGPNHPVLTARGWVRAQALRDGDDVISHHMADRQHATMPVTCVSGGHDDQRPAQIEEIFRALCAVPRHARVVATPAHFHGDGNFCQGEVEVVWTDRALPLERETARFQPAGERVLVGAHAQAQPLPRQGATDLALKGIGPSAPRRIGGERVGRIAGPGADRDAALLQPLTKHSVANARLARQLQGRCAGLVTRDEVVEVRNIEAFIGHAFDLETAYHAYFAGGLLVSNCVRSFEPISDADAGEAEGAADDVE